MTITKNQILKAIGCPHLTLWRGKGYYWFQYDTFYKKNTGNDGKYDTQSIHVMYLKDMSIDNWVEDGKAFVAKMENK